MYGSRSTQGLYATLMAFIIWGFFPLYWSLLKHVPALQVMANRLIWCAVLVSGYLFIMRGMSWLTQFKGQRKLLTTLSCTGVLIAINWGLYIWAVSNGHVIESSLGYFITPLVNVLLAVVVLKERLSMGQKLAFSFAGAGVLWLTIAFGQLPWVALSLAASFGAYGLLRKITAVDSISGLAIESLILFPLMLGFLIWWQVTGVSHLTPAAPQTSFLLILGGLVTAIPLILFAYGAQRIPLATVGLLQYVGPTIQFLCGWLIFDEAFGGDRAVGFGLIWLGCAIYLGESLLRARRSAAPAPVSGAP